MRKQNFYMYFNEKRYETGGMPKKSPKKSEAQDWRMRDRLKTVSAVLPICLNIGVDPPDVFKTSPCAKLECWVDPTAISNTSGTSTAIHQIGKNLQSQYEQLSMRTRYKVLSDPTSEELKKYCTTMRKNAKDERILFHFNGHGVPKPTPSGEIWVFNKNFTQYIPISLFDLQAWLGAPSILVYDCINAGLIVKNFIRFVEKHQTQNVEDRKRDPTIPPVNFGDCIQLAACAEDEMLPTSPMLPADLFTSCLTTPIEIAVRFYLMQSPLTKTSFRLDDASKIPGRSQERRTPIGELNWIFTAITDTIAWNTLPKPLFKRLFRQDLMVAALFRNFLLAQRIMRAYHCHPVSFPAIPSTHDHPLWDSWDLAVELVMTQLPNLLLAQEKKIEYEYMHSDFFKDQLTAFEVYLDQGAREQKEPEQLPIVLQVLLSQVHRLRALVLLSRFLDLGPWAVNLALGIGIFPYVLKLLQSQAQDLKAPLVFIWARVLAVDKECQSDLLKDNGYQYFVSILNPATGLPVSTISEHRAMCAFIIAMFCKDFRAGQHAAHSYELVTSLQHYISWRHNDNPVLRQWSVLCLSSLWNGYTEAKWSGIKCGVQRDLCELATDPVPEVRTAMIYALTAFIGIPDLTDEIAAHEEEIALRLMPLAKDACSIVRKELTIFLSAFVARYLNKFVISAAESMYDEVEALIVEDLNYEEEVPAAEPEDENEAHPVENGYARSKSTNMLGGKARSNDQTRKMSDQTLVGSTETGNSTVNTTNGTRSRPKFTLSSSSPDDQLDEQVNGQQEPRKVWRTRDDAEKLSQNTIHFALWRLLLVLSCDPDIQVSQNSTMVIWTVLRRVIKEVPHGPVLFAYYQELVPRLIPKEPVQKPAARHQVQFETPAVPETPSHQQRSEGYFSASIKRTASVAASLRNLAFGNSIHEKSTQSAPHTPPRTPSIGSEQADKQQPTIHSMHEYVDDGPTNHYGHFKYPAPDWFHTVNSDDAFHLPLKSDFFDYAVEYFREYQMKVAEDEEPGSRDYNERLWRRNRNEQILDITQRMKSFAGTNRWDNQYGMFNNKMQPVTMAFHQYENHLIVADPCDNIRVWDWEQQKPLNRLSNGNPPGTSVTSVRFINEDDQALLMTGSSDGAMRIFKDYDDGKLTQVLSAFNTMPRPDPPLNNRGLVLDWLQGRGLILAAGDAKSIRIWSAHTELLDREIPVSPSPSGNITTSPSSVTSMTSDQVEGHIIVTGFDNGAVRVYDQRMAPQSAIVKTWQEHKSAVVSVYLQRGGQRELISASEDGMVKLWDLRNESSLKSIPTLKEGIAVKTLSVHEHAPVFVV